MRSLRKTMTVHLLNTAMMPAADGTYTSVGITVSEFTQRAITAYDTGTLVSYIGYKSTADLLSDLCGFEIRENRSKTSIADGDVLLIARVKHRLGQRMQADVKPTLDEMEFRVVYYSENSNII